MKKFKKAMYNLSVTIKTIGKILLTFSVMIFMAVFFFFLVLLTELLIGKYQKVEDIVAFIAVTSVLVCVDKLIKYIREKLKK